MKNLDFIGYVGLFLGVFGAFFPDLRNLKIPFWMVLVSFSLLILFINYFNQRYFGAFESDKNLFLEVASLLPSDWGGTMYFLKEHDFHYSFERNKFSPIFSFVEAYAPKPGFVFHTLALEKSRKKLCENLKDFLTVLCDETCPLGQEQQGVPKEEEVMMHNVDMSYEKAEKMRDEKVKKLNDSSALAYKAYEDFINVGVKKLKVYVSIGPKSHG